MNVASPGPSCVVVFIVTYPVHMVSIPKIDAPVEFEERSAVYACD